MGTASCVLLNPRKSLFQFSSPGFHICSNLKEKGKKNAWQKHFQYVQGRQAGKAQANSSCMKEQALLYLVLCVGWACFLNSDPLEECGNARICCFFLRNSGLLACMCK